MRVRWQSPRFEHLIRLPRQALQVTKTETLSTDLPWPAKLDGYFIDFISFLAIDFKKDVILLR